MAKKRTSSKSDVSTIPMAGFPLSQLDRYLRILVKELNCSVAIVDQYEKDFTAHRREAYTDNMKFDRRVTRIVTPGTLLDESFIDWQQNNYLLAVTLPKSSQRFKDTTRVGLAWLNLGIGTFFTESTTIANLMSDISRIHPCEILIDQSMENRNFEKGNWHIDLAELSNYYVNYQPFPSNDRLDSYRSLFDDHDNSMINKVIDDISPLELQAVMGILNYVQTHLPEIPFTLQLPEQKRSNRIMKIDNRSRHSLELLKSIRSDSSTGTLLSTIKCTVSDSGTRLLTEWMKEPLLDLDEISERQDYVEELMNNTVLLSQIRYLIGTANDPARTIQKLGLGRGTVFDLYSLAQDLKLFQDVKSTISKSPNTNQKGSSKLKSLSQSLAPCSSIFKKIMDDIDHDALVAKMQIENEADEEEFDDGLSIIGPNENNVPNKKQSTLSSQKQKQIISQKFNGTLDEWFIKSSSSRKLQSLHDQLNSLKQNQYDLEESLNNKYNEASIKLELKWSPALGYHVYVTAGKSAADINILLESEKENILTRHKKTITIHNKDWSEIGASNEKVRADIRSEEKKIINRLRDMVCNIE